jgi:hypothetical protein
MIAGGGELEDGGGTTRTVAIASRDVVGDPPFALELEELLPDRFTRKVQHTSEFRDGGDPAILQFRQNRATAVRELGERNEALLSNGGTTDAPFR